MPGKSRADVLIPLATGIEWAGASASAGRRTVIFRMPLTDCLPELKCGAKPRPCLG